MAFASAETRTRTRHQHHRIAVGSFIEEYSNRVDILSFDPDTLSIKPNPTLSFDHPYQTTKIMFHPNPSTLHKTNDVLASSGDYLRLWEVGDSELERHRGSVNAIAWAPQSCRHICSAGDDTQALIWDLPTVAGPNGIDPMSMYSAGAEINQLQWSAAQPDWISIAFSNKMQLLKV